MFKNLVARPETFSRNGGSNSKKVFIRKVKDNPNAVSTYTGFENYGALSVPSQKLERCIFGKTETNAITGQ